MKESQVSHFVGRDKELQLLKASTQGKEPNITVIYGRRRVGKSALISKTLEKQKALYFEGLENRPKKEQIANFCLQLSKQTGEKIPSIPKSWSEAFLYLEAYIKKSPQCIVLDEFQWMANYRAEIVSSLKMVWDQYFSKIPGVHLILSGSIASFMLSKVVRSSAMYGRTNQIIHLQPFNLSETKKMLPEMGIDEIVETQMIFGGVPKYLELVKKYQSLYIAIDELAFKEHGYLNEEYERIFVSHFGRNDDYKKIIETLAKNAYGLNRGELATKAKIEKGGGFTRLLEDLESAGFITAINPLGKKQNSRLIQYFLSDAFLRFYYAFMKRKMKPSFKFESEIKFTELAQQPKYHSWKGRAFELVCLQHITKIVKILGFSGIKYSCGPFYQAPKKTTEGLQIDLAIERADNIITICEMKCSRSQIGKAIISEIESKAERLKNLLPRKTIQSVLIHFGPLSKEVEHTPYIYKKINVEELF